MNQRQLGQLESAFRKRAPRDPVWFAEKILGVRLWDMQREIVESVRDVHATAVRSCHGPGKTFTAAVTALWFLYSHPNSIVLTTAPTDRQVKNLLWKDIRRLYKNALIPLGGRCLTQAIYPSEKHAGWYALGFTARSYDPNSFQGFHAESILAIIDEAAGVTSDIYEAIDGVLSSRHSRKLLIGNPTDESGDFGRAFKDPKFNKFVISAFDTPNFTTTGITLEDIRSGEWEAKAPDTLPYPALVTPEWVADRWRPQSWGEGSPQWTAKVLGDFPELGTDMLIPLAWIERAETRTFVEHPDTKTYLGVDVARFGDDESIIYARRGRNYWPVERVKGKATTEIAGYVKRALDSTGAIMARVDEIGIGAGVVDQLQEQGLPVIGVNVGAAARDPDQFKNLRAEMYWGLRKQYETGEIALAEGPGSEDLKAQLSSIKFKYDSRGRIQIEAKEEMKKRGMPSPDLADAHALASLAGFEHIDESDIIVGERPTDFGEMSIADAWGDLEAALGKR